MHVITDDPPSTDAPDRAVELGELSDAEVFAFCLDDERQRRRAEGLLVHGMIELERRKAYTADGFRDLAGWGQGVYRWQPEVARARRNLAKLAVTCPQVVQHLLQGQLGVDQAHFIGRAFRWPRVGIFVPMFIDEILEHARTYSYVEFVAKMKQWRSLVDEDGPDPERAHRDRSASVAFTDHEFRLVVTGPNIDGAAFATLLQHYEQQEFEADWAICKDEWGDQARPDLMPRTSHQRRYDAFIRLLSHVGRPTDTTDPDEVEAETDTDTEIGTDTEISAQARRDESTGRPSSPPVELVTNVVIDWRTFLHELDAAMGCRLQRDLRPPFGPDSGFSRTFDGINIAARDAVLAAIYGKFRLVVTDDDGVPIQMTSSSRLFTGRMRDAVLMTAINCTHPGCGRASTDCQIDHTIPWSEGGCTCARNGNPGCRHHNIYRHLSGARVRRRRDGSWATLRPDGTEVAPPM